MKEKGVRFARWGRVCLLVASGYAQAQTPAMAPYAIGPGDQLSVWALGIDENTTKSLVVDPDGCIDIPMIGRVKAGGLSVEQLKQNLTGQLKAYVKEPEVTVSISDYHSQPVSVVGAVKEPGVRDLRGGKRLLEVLAQAGGLTADAGNTVYVTRRKEWGKPLVPGVPEEESADSTTVKIPVAGLLQDGKSEYNIPVRPNDTIIVPRAHMVYVMGEVNKPGGYVLNEKDGISVLQALSLAGGITRTASAKSARILRPIPGGASRDEIDLNLKRILSASARDVELRPDDILFVPNSASKSATLRAIETGIQVSTGLIIWR